LALFWEGASIAPYSALKAKSISAGENRLLPVPNFLPVAQINILHRMFGSHFSSDLHTQAMRHFILSVKL